MKITSFLRVRLRARRPGTRSLLLSGLMLAAAPMAYAGDSPAAASASTAVTATPSTPSAATVATPACDATGCDAIACDSPDEAKAGGKRAASRRAACDAPGDDGCAASSLLSSVGKSHLSDCDAPGCDTTASDPPACDSPACDSPACDSGGDGHGVVAANGRIQSQLRLGSLFGGLGLHSAGAHAADCAAPDCSTPDCDASPGNASPRHEGVRQGLGLLKLSRGLTCDAPAATCDAGGCDAGTCDACDEAITTSCTPCTNQWSVWKEVMFLRRSDASAYPLITDQNTGETLLNANQLDFEHRAVPRIFLIRDYCDCWGWEIGYFGLQTWDSSGEGGGEQSPVLNGPGIPIGSTQPGTVYQVNYGSDLHNAEFNVRRRASRCVTWIAGFRFVELQEHLNAGSVAPTTSDLYSVDTNNQLYGFQVGANAQLLNCGGRFHVDGIFRTGIFSNSAGQTTHSPLGDVIPESATSLSASATQTAFLGELGLRGVYQLTDWLGVYGGYSAIWVDGLALAPAQVAATNLFGTPSASINTTDAVFFHGATVGMQASF